MSARASGRGGIIVVGAMRSFVEGANPSPYHPYNPISFMK